MCFLAVSLAALEAPFPPQEVNNCGATKPPASNKEACFKNSRLFCIALKF